MLLPAIYLKVCCTEYRGYARHEYLYSNISVAAEFSHGVLIVLSASQTGSSRFSNFAGVTREKEHITVLATNRASFSVSVIANSLLPQRPGFLLHRFLPVGHGCRKGGSIFFLADQRSGNELYFSSLFTKRSQSSLHQTLSSQLASENICISQKATELSVLPTSISTQRQNSTRRRSKPQMK